MGDRIRSFLAVLLPPALVAAAAEIQGQARERFTPGTVRWVDPALFHLTLRFFGDLDREQVERARAVLREFDHRVPPAPVRIGAVSAFPNPARPQTLWIAVEDAPAETRGAASTARTLADLAAEVDRRLRTAGFGPADKAWKSHLTIGRAARDARLKMDPDWTTGLPRPSGEFRIDRLALMRSELRPQGPRYTPLQEAVLDGSEPG